MSNPTQQRDASHRARKAKARNAHKQDFCSWKKRKLEKPVTKMRGGALKEEAILALIARIILEGEAP